MARFSAKKKKWGSRGIILPVVLFALLLCFFLAGVSGVGEGTVKRQKDALESALTRDITQCYADEGHYPADVYYLTEHYGLRYNEDRFYVDYHLKGGNLRPEYRVIVREDTDE
ncbi:MAG: hypothetical protein IJJ38_06990 [Lachnospiraceae bacterium]|nr:hypothetical protein [Lachnospiraceae bacterium]